MSVAESSQATMLKQRLTRKMRFVVAGSRQHEITNKGNSKKAEGIGTKVIDQPEVIKKILQHLGLWEESHAPPGRNPAIKKLTFDPSYSQLI